MIVKIFLDTDTGLFCFRKDRGVPVKITKQEFKKWSAKLHTARVQTILERKYKEGLKELFKDDWT
jgi:hypothetical protein